MWNAGDMEANKNRWLPGSSDGQTDHNEIMVFPWGHGFVIVPSRDEPKALNTMSSEEQQVEHFLQSLNTFDGFHLIWLKGSLICPPKLLPIYRPKPFWSPNGIAPIDEVTFHLENDMNRVGCCTPVATVSPRVTFSQNGIAKIYADVARVNSKDRTADVYVCQNTAPIGNLRITPLIENGTTLRNRLTARGFFVTKMKEKNCPGFLVYDESNRSRPVAEAEATSCLKGYASLHGIRLDYVKEWIEFKMVFYPGSHLTVTDKVLMMTLLKAWAVHVKERKSNPFGLHLLFKIILFGILLFGFVFLATKSH